GLALRGASATGGVGGVGDGAPGCPVRAALSAGRAGVPAGVRDPGGRRAVAALVLGGPGAGGARAAVEVDGGDLAPGAAGAGRVPARAARRRPGWLGGTGGAAGMGREAAVRGAQRGGERDGAAGARACQGNQADRRAWRRGSRGDLGLLPGVLPVEDGGA